MLTVGIIGTLDTKGREFQFVKELFEARGIHTLLIHAGTFEPTIDPDISAHDVATAGGAHLHDLVAKKDRGEAVAALTRGIEKLIPQLYAEGKIHGVFSLGGSGGTALATAGMRALPIGVPKVMVSTMASAGAEYVGTSDIVMVPSIVDVQGLNEISIKIFENAVGATVGMMTTEHRDVEHKPLIAASMFGVTTPCITKAQEYLEERGYEVVVFHATGAGGKTMERLISEGFFAGVLDLTTTEWCDEIAGGILAAGPHRNEAAALGGVPQVVSVGAMDMVNFGAPDSVPDKYRDRTFYPHNPQVTLMRTTPEESRKLGEILAEKLNRATGPTALVLPRGGVSMIATQGQPFYDPQADKELFGALTSKVDTSKVEVIDSDLDINNSEFATLAAQKLIDLIEQEK